MRTTGFLLLAAAFAAAAQEPPRAGGEQVYVTAIEVVADVRDAAGKLPAGLQPADFVVIEEGVERAVVGLDYLRAERVAGAIDTGGTPEAKTTATTAAERPLWQNVLYFETTLANGTGRTAAARTMINHIDTLIEIGTVDVVFANPTPVALVRNSRDAAAIRAALEKVASSSGINQLAAHRRQYLRDVDSLISVIALKGNSAQPGVVLDYDRNPQVRREFNGADASAQHAINTNNIVPYIEHEVRMISDFRESLMAWLSSYRRHVPRNLLMVTDGFDLDPVEFYGASAPSNAQVALRNYVSQSKLGGTAMRMAESLAAGGWTTVSIPSDNNADGWVDDASVSAIGRVHNSINATPKSNPKAFFIRPLDPLNAVAEATGGKVVSNSAQLGGVLESLDDRVKLTYQVDRRPDGKTRKIEIRARNSNLEVRGARFATSATPDDLAQTRAVGLLKNATYLGDLATKGGVEWSKQPGPRKIGTLHAVTDVALVKQLLPPGAKGQFRITLAVQVGKEAIVVNRSVADQELAENVFRFRTPLELPPTASALVLIIEETTTGAWGSTRIDIPS